MAFVGEVGVGAEVGGPWRGDGVGTIPYKKLGEGRQVARGSYLVSFR